MKIPLEKRYLIPALIVSLLVIFFIARGGDDVEEGIFYTVERGDFVISIVEGGSLDAVNEIVVRNAIEGESRIISLIPEGDYVEKGDLLVEFDAGEAENIVETQRVAFEARQAALVQAENALIITNSTVASDVSGAELEVQFATMDLEKFEKLEKVHTIREAELKIDTADEALKLAQQRYEWSIKLAEKGFETKTQVDRDKLDVSLKSKEFETSQSNFQILEAFDLKKMLAEYLSKKKEAISSLERAKKQGESKIAQNEAEVNSSKVTLRLTEESLAKKIEQLAATKVFAPKPGLVIYAKSSNRWSGDQIIEGAVVRNRMELVKIPDVSSMKVIVKVHESMVSQVKIGQKAYIVLDSIPDQRFEGEVTKVAILPDSDRSWMNPDLKVYSTEIVISDTIEGVKPGVSAKAEIVIKELSDVLTVPIQAVTTLDGKQLCYVNKGGGAPEPVEVEVGNFNTKYIEIRSGLKKDDQVMLNPPLDSRINLTGETTETAPAK